MECLADNENFSQAVPNAGEVRFRQIVGKTQSLGAINAETLQELVKGDGTLDLWSEQFINTSLLTISKGVNHFSHRASQRRH